MEKDKNTEQYDWFTKEVLPHEQDLRSWLSVRFSSLDDIDDVIQEAYSKLLKVHATGPVVNPRAFLFVTTRNIALNIIRHSRYEMKSEGNSSIEAMSIVDDSVLPSDKAIVSEELQLLIEAIRHLPKRCRQIITLRKIYGLSQKEVALKLGISTHTVETQAAIGLKKCINYFSCHGYQKEEL